MRNPYPAFLIRAFLMGEITMTDREIRKAFLKSHIKKIDETIYPDGYEECKMIMLVALKDRLRSLEQLETVDYLPTSQRY